MEETKCMLLSERGHSEKATYCMTATLRHSAKDKTMETKKKNSGCQGLGGRGE